MRESKSRSLAMVGCLLLDGGWPGVTGGQRVAAQLFKMGTWNRYLTLGGIDGSMMVALTITSQIQYVMVVRAHAGYFSVVYPRTASQEDIPERQSRY